MNEPRQKSSKICIHPLDPAISWAHECYLIQQCQRQIGVMERSLAIVGRLHGEYFEGQCLDGDCILLLGDDIQTWVPLAGRVVLRRSGCQHHASVSCPIPDQTLDRTRRSNMPLPESTPPMSSKRVVEKGTSPTLATAAEADRVPVVLCDCYCQTDRRCLSLGKNCAWSIAADHERS